MKVLFSLPILSKIAVNVIFILLFNLSACSGIETLKDETVERETATETESRDNSDLEALYWSRLEDSRMSVVRADIDFMTDMISHHSQALIMSKLAPKNGASYSVQTLASRIHNAQQDEIATMQKWLRDRNQPVPEIHIEGLMLSVHVAEEAPTEMEHSKMDHGRHQGEGKSEEVMESAESRSGHNMSHHDMPGMLTQEQLEELASATGVEFDRKFLTFMIEHHEGAVYMVNELFEADGAGNDNEIFDLASGIHVEQITEINRMKLMLEEIEED